MQFSCNMGGSMRPQGWLPAWSSISPPGHPGPRWNTSPGLNRRCFKPQQMVVQATNIFVWTWCFKLRKWLSQRRLQWRGSEVFYSLLQADGFSLVFARREGSWDYGCVFNDMIPFLQCGAPSFCLLLNTKVPFLPEPQHFAWLSGSSLLR